MTTVPTTPKRKTFRQEWDTPTRVRAITLLDTGLGVTEVSRRTGVPRSTVSKWKKKPQPRRTHTRPGRPPKLDKHDIRRLNEILRSGWEGRKISWAELGKQAGLNVSAKSIKRALDRNLRSTHRECVKKYEAAHQSAH
jgi:transposase